MLLKERNYKMSNVKAAISILWCLFAIVSGSYYFVLTNDVQNLEKELAQINRDIEKDIRDIHILEADWSELNNPERLKVLASQYISLDFIKPEQIINYSALHFNYEDGTQAGTRAAPNRKGLTTLVKAEVKKK